MKSVSRCSNAVAIIIATIVAVSMWVLLIAGSLVIGAMFSQELRTAFGVFIIGGLFYGLASCWVYTQIKKIVRRQIFWAFIPKGRCVTVYI